MIDAVEPVTANALLEPFVRTRIGFRGQRHVAMKASVEDGDLRYRTQQFRNKLHAFELSAIVERSKNGNISNRRFDLRGHKRRVKMFRTSMDHAVPNQVDFRRIGNRLRFASPQSLEQALDGLAARTD